MNFIRPILIPLVFLFLVSIPYKISDILLLDVYVYLFSAETRTCSVIRENMIRMYLAKEGEYADIRSGQCA